MEPSPGPLTRGNSQRLERRKSTGPYSGHSRRRSSVGSSAGSTGLTKYVGEVDLSFEEKPARSSRRSSSASGAEEKEDEVPDMLPSKSKRKADDAVAEDDGDLSARSVSTFGRALSSFRQGGKAAGPKEIDLWKPEADAILGVTFEVPEDPSLKGVVVAQIHAGYLMSRSKKLRVGDVVHAVNGYPVTTPQEGATLLREAKGVIQLVVSRVNAKPKVVDDGEGSDGDKLEKSRSFLPMALKLGGKKKKESGEREEEAGTDDAGNTTVVVSCSQLILESKKIVGEAAGLDESLDTLYTRLKAKEVGSQAALAELMTLVGQTTVEQAGLVIANKHQGTLPDGWVEYFDKETSRCYYYNVHTKTTTWHKPRKDKPPPPPPPGAPPGRRRSSMGVASNSTSQGHGVAAAIAEMQTKKKMIEAVQVECSTTHRPGGLVSVSL